MINVAYIVIEAKTPLKIGSNESSLLKDAPVQKDWNNLPMILGTSIAGVLRREFDGDVDEIFGSQNGSRVMFSNALLVDENMRVSEELLLEKSNFLKSFENLPIREHTAISHKGVTKDKSKFDEEVVYKGARFKFSITIEDNLESFEKILDSLYNQTFRLGGGTTKGYGEIEVIKITTDSFTNEEYIDFQNSLNTTLNSNYTSKTKKEFTTYTLRLTPDDFFIFGSGFGDSDADMIAVTEDVIVWSDNKPDFKKKELLIPASSIKGAISHRVAYYYNKKNNIFVDMMSSDEFDNYQEEKNPAVMDIFGHKKELDKDTKIELGQKGKILISDCFKSSYETKVFDHVAIDRFTSGAIDGALFQEKVVHSDEFEITITLRENIKYLDIFEDVLKDICNGLLSLGGMTTKGYGVFSGRCYRDGEEI